MKSRSLLFYTVSLVVTLFLVSACNSNSEISPALTVNFLGTGSGTVTLAAPGADYRQDFTESFPTGTTVAMTAAADDDSFFVGWEGDCSNPDAATCEVLVDAGKNVRATFAKKTHTLTLQPEGTGMGQTRVVDADGKETLCREKCELTFAAGTALTLTASADQGSSFTSWGQDCVATGTTCDLVVDAPKTVTATFDKVGASSFDLVVTKMGSGAVTSDPAGINCGSDCRETYAKDSVITLSAVPAAGWTFSGWSDGCVGTGACRVTLNTSKTVTATFTENQVQLTLDLAGTGTGRVTSEPAGLNCPATCTASFDDGTQVTLSAAPEAGSSFSGWSGACTGTSTCTVTLNASKTVTATFTQKQVRLAVSVTGAGNVISSPVGLNCPATCTASFAYGTEVVLSATPTSGSSFAGWGGACSGTSCTLKLTADSSVTATFTPGAGGTEKTVTATIIRGSDDAEQYLKAVTVKREKPAGTYESFPANAVDIKSGDIDLTFESDVATTNQIVGLRFSNLDIPPGATITDARIQFTVDHPTSGYVKLYFYGQANPNAPTFVHQGVGDISDRPKTDAVVPWEPAAWNSVEGTVNDPAALTVNLAPIVQEVINLPGWQKSKNGLAFIIESDPANGTHRRRATSFEDSDPNTKLIVTYRY